MSWTNVSGQTAVAPGGGGTFSTVNINTLTATMLTVVVVWDNSQAIPALTDSRGNVWTQVADITALGGGTAVVRMRMFYTAVAAPVVGSTHSITLTGTSRGTALFAAWKDSFGGRASCLNNSNTKAAAGTSLTLVHDSLTPNAPNSLIISTLGYDTSASATTVTGGGLSPFLSRQGVFEQNQGGFLGVGEQIGAAVGFAGTWTWTGTNHWGIGIQASFSSATLNPPGGIASRTRRIGNFGIRAR